MNLQPSRQALAVLYALRVTGKRRITFATYRGLAKKLPILAQRLRRDPEELRPLIHELVRAGRIRFREQPGKAPAISRAPMSSHHGEAVHA